MSADRHKYSNSAAELKFNRIFPLISSSLRSSIPFSSEYNIFSLSDNELLGNDVLMMLPSSFISFAYIIVCDEVSLSSETVAASALELSLKNPF